MTETARAHGTSLWLMPEGTARERLASRITDLATRLGTTPFAPHATLLPGLSGPEAAVLEEARALAGELAPVELRPVGVAGRDEHFRCLFLRLRRSRALAAAHARAASRFARDPDPDLDPHVSLVYAELSPRVKAALIEELSPELPRAFVARRLHVWRTEGPVAEWRELDAIPLG